ncbi:MAG: extracellular solute-binding protein [Parvularculales bacterium]
MSRRQLLKAAGAGVAAAGIGLAAPAVHSAKEKIIRYLGTATTMADDIRRKLLEDTGIRIEYLPLTTDEVTLRILTRPGTFDIVDTEYASLPRFVLTGKILGMDSKRIKEFDNISTIHTLGKIGDKIIGDQGTAPKKVFYLNHDHSREFSPEPTRWTTLVPTVFNADTLGIRPDLINRPIDSWAELLNPEFRGKASIQNIPSIGIIDAAMVVEAIGEYVYPDKGNMTKTEIDLTIDIFREAKMAGQFRTFWKDFNESVDLMASGEVVIQSMWSPAVTAVRTQGIPCTYQPLKEGYRGWGSGFALSAAITEYQVDLCYEFINWYLSGFAGGYLNRQGFYSAVPSTAKQYMEDYEWDYWMLGKPATQDIKAPDGQKLASVGEVRDGGSFEERMGAVACWNSTMDERRHLADRWNNFVAA